MAFDQSNSNLSIAALLRCCADGELNDQQRAKIEAHLASHPDDAMRVEFEHQLRKACERSMAGSAKCPEALRKRVMALAAASAHSGTGQTDAEHAHAPLPVALAPKTRNPSFWISTSRFMAVAAAVLLGLTLAFQVGRWSVVAPASPEGGAQVVLATRATEFVRREHSRCAKLRDAEVGNKFTATEAEGLTGAFQSVLGMNLTLEDLIAHADSVRFVDAGRCGVPGGRSLHIRLSTLAQGQEHTASLFVQEDTGRLQLAEGTTYQFAEGEENERPSVYVWRRAGLFYWLVCDRSDSTRMIEALGAPQVRSGQV